MAALLGESDEVREDHAAKTDMVERLDRAGLDVLRMVVVQSSLDRFLHVIEREHRLQVARKLLYLHPLDLIVELTHCHFRFLCCANPNPSFGLPQKFRGESDDVGNSLTMSGQCFFFGAQKIIVYWLRSDGSNDPGPLITNLPDQRLTRIGSSRGQKY